MKRLNKLLNQEVIDEIDQVEIVETFKDEIKKQNYLIRVYRN